MWTVIDSPIGRLRLVEHDGRLVAIDFSPFDEQRRVLVGGGAGSAADGDRDDTVPVLVETIRQLGEYFAGERTTFDVPMAAVGTEFQHRVWAELVKIPYGVTVTYGEIARRLGLGNAASRAVGSANGSNPIPVIVPCHRVIGANGKLTGYAGGLDRKQTLLELERPPEPQLTLGV